jgi:hypothetical protein
MSEPDSPIGALIFAAETLVANFLEALNRYLIKIIEKREKK